MTFFNHSCKIEEDSCKIENLLTGPYFLDRKPHEMVFKNYVSRTSP